MAKKDEDLVAHFRQDVSEIQDFASEVQRRYELQRRQVEPLKELIKDCLEAMTLLSHYILADGSDLGDDPDETIFAISSSLESRFRQIDPDWSGILPLESPAFAETSEELIRRLSSNRTEE